MGLAEFFGVLRLRSSKATNFAQDDRYFGNRDLEIEWIAMS